MKIIIITTNIIIYVVLNILHITIEKFYIFNKQLFFRIENWF